MYSRQPLVVFPRLLRRVSQFPRRIFPCALSPSTPESPVVSFSRCFHHRWQASPCFGRLAVFHLRHEAESGLLSLRLAGSPPEAPSNGLLRFTLVRLHVERVIHMVDSFHSTRFASLLAHQSSQRNAKKNWVWFSLRSLRALRETLLSLFVRTSTQAPPSPRSGAARRFGLSG